MNNLTRRMTLAIISMLWLMASSVQADTTTVYKSTDKAGNPQFSDEPNAGASNEQQLDIKDKPKGQLPPPPNAPPADGKAAKARQAYQVQRIQLVSQINLLKTQLAHAKTDYQNAQQALDRQMNTYRFGYDHRRYRQRDLAIYRQNVLTTKRQVFRLERALNNKRGELRILDQRNYP